MSSYLPSTKQIYYNMYGESNKRSFVLGEEWIYYKLYTGVKTADKILENAIKPATEYLTKKKYIDKWFFIRYSDPELHLRVRLHCTSTESLALIISTFYKYIQDFIASEAIWKLQTDTYQRELERYGDQTIQYSEDLFFLESQLIVNLLSFLDTSNGETKRWLIALKLIDSFLDSFKCKLTDKLRILENLRESFRKELGISKSICGNKFLKDRLVIEKCLNPYLEQDSQIKEFLTQLELHKKSIIPVADNIIVNFINNRPKISFDNLLGSFLHMSMNRLFRSKQRIHEMVIYDYLFRYYQSLIFRLKLSSKETKI